MGQLNISFRMDQRSDRNCFVVPSDDNGTFTYSYDNRDRLTREIKHDGSELLYGYDVNGNRTTLTTLVAKVRSFRIFKSPDKFFVTIDGRKSREGEWLVVGPVQGIPTFVK